MANLKKSLKTLKWKFIRILFGTRNEWPLWLLVFEAKRGFRHFRGYDINLSDPVTFHEKRLWYSLFYRNPMLPNIVDKISFKSYIENKLGPGHTIPLLGVWDSVEEIEKSWDSLPEEVVFKSNLSCEENNIMILHERSKIPFESVRDFFIKALDPYNTLKDSYAWAYQGCSPRILAEEFRTNSGTKLFDYKFFCFHGEPRYVYVDRDHTITFYDMDWNRQDVRYSAYNVGMSPRPEHFDEMADMARRLSKDFPFVRVDFYDVGGQVYLGEMTFYAGGISSYFNPDSFDHLLGSFFDLKRIPQKDVARFREARKAIGC